MSGGKDRGGKIYGGVFVLVFLLAFVVPLLWSMYDDGVFDGDKADIQTAPVFGPREAGRLVERLDTAAKAQGVCYGWVIDSGRSARIPVVTPSYSGTFTPQPTTAPTTVPTTAPTTVPSPAASPASTVRPRSTALPRSTARPRATASPRPSNTQPTVPPLVERELTRPGVEFGSNLGVGVDPRQAPARCPKWAILKADYYYSSTYKEWTSGSITLEDNVGLAGSLHITGAEARLDVTSTDLTGDYAVARLADAIGSVPLLVAEDGRARPVAPAAAPVPAGDEISSGRGAGFYVFTTIAIALIAGGVLWIAVAAVRSRKGSS
ncbi:hypothetical protein ACQEU3_24470 [Spirillospora sp. CA-253888]